MDNQSGQRARQQPTPERDPMDSNPLQGAVLCCTSIPPEKRTELASQAEQMGAQHKYDLTSEVTHLIVGDYDTPKYRYVAKERPDVKILKPEWVEEIRRLWIEDRSIDVEELERQYTLSTFATLKLCVTGFDDIIERQRIMDLVQEHGGEYHGDLTKKVTHLIVNRPEGAKYKHAKNWGLHLVSIEWLHDSIERGMILDEHLYHPEMSKEERGKGAWIRRTILSSSLGKRARDGSVASLEEGRRKLRRTASSKLSSQNGKIWGDIVGGSNTAQTTTNGEADQSDGQEIHCQAKADEIKGIAGNDVLLVKQPSTFSGCLFFIDGFDRKKTQVLIQHLTSHDGKIVDSIDDLTASSHGQSYVVKPHTKALPNPFIYPDGLKIVTDFWVERCLESKSCIDLERYPLGTSFPYIPTPGFEGLIICSTSFEGMQLRHISQAVSLAGAQYNESFTKHASVLICDPNRQLRKEKLACATAWKIPIVSINWLTDSIESGERQLFKPYLLRQQKSPKDEKLDTTVTEPKLSEERELKRSHRAERQVLEQRPSKHPRPPKSSGLDLTAFDDTPIEIKREDFPLPPTAKPASLSNTTSTTSTIATEPLNEISSNSQRKSPSPSKASQPQTIELTSPPLIHPISLPPVSEDLTTAISSLLARSKPQQPTSTSGLPSSDKAAVDASTTGVTTGVPTDLKAEAGRKPRRNQTRILGRAASNVSASGTFSRGSSVDSTASRGQAVIWPSNSTSNQNSNSKATNISAASASISASAAATAAADSLVTSTLVGDSHNKKNKNSLSQQHQPLHPSPSGKRDEEPDPLAPPPQTQSLRYEDEESSEYRAMLLARMAAGDVGSRASETRAVNKEKDRVWEKERVATIGSLDLDPLVAAGGGQKGRMIRGGRVLRDRGSGSGGGGGGLR